MRQRGWHCSSKVTPSQQHSPALLPRGHCPPPQPKQGQLPPSLLHSLLDLGQEGAQDPSPQLTWMMQEERRPGLRGGGCWGWGGHAAGRMPVVTAVRVTGQDLGQAQRNPHYFGVTSPKSIAIVQSPQGDDSRPPPPQPPHGDAQLCSDLGCASILGTYGVTLWGVIPPTSVPTVGTRKKSYSSRETALSTPALWGGLCHLWAHGLCGGQSTSYSPLSLSPHSSPLLSCPIAAPHHNPSS